MNKEFLHMQKLAGIITESEYTAKLKEASDEEQQDSSQQKDVASIDKKEFYIGSVDGFDVYELPKGRKDLYAVALELNIVPNIGWVHSTDVGVKSYFDQYIEKGPLFIFSKPGSKEKYIFSYEKKEFQNKNGDFITEQDPNVINLFKFIESKKPEYKTPIEIKLLQSPELISPEDLNVKGDINLWYSHLKSLPDNLTVNGNLNIRNTPIKSLPNNLTVDGDIDIKSTSISSIPNKLNAKSIDVYDTPIGKKYSDKQILKMIKNKGGNVGHAVGGNMWKDM
jgi:hypothetical protein